MRPKIQEQMKNELKSLLESKLITKRVTPFGNLYKYSRRVFYDNLWHEHELLLECRGLITNETDDYIVQRPFKKVFNLGENNTTVDANKTVRVVRKVNGFMAAATKHLVSTTGTTDSDFAKLAQDRIGDTGMFSDELTYLFEICDESDPHIITEDSGAYLIGIRDKNTGKLVCEQTLDEFANHHNFKRPEHFECRFDEILKLSKTVKHEGFMIIDPTTNEHLCKIKSPFYLSKKFLQRMSQPRIEEMFDDPEKVKKKIDEEFYDIVDFITKEYTKQDWKSYNEQERSQIIFDKLS